MIDIQIREKQQQIFYLAWLEKWEKKFHATPDMKK